MPEYKPYILVSRAIIIGVEITVLHLCGKMTETTNDHEQHHEMIKMSVVTLTP